MKRRRVTLLAVLIGAAAGARAEQTIDLANRRELFVDSFLVGSMSGTELRMHPPCRAGVALRFDRPWEGAFCGYATVIFDRGTYRMYYRGLPDAGRDGSAAEVTCYAESRDGIDWTKPRLGRFDIAGTRDNNIVLANEAPATHNFSPFLDGSPNVSSDARYKALGGTAESGLIGFVSPDGLNWTKVSQQPIFRDTGWVFDSQNVCFWSQAEQCYVLYYRRSVEGVRSVARATSADFRNWSKPVQMSFGATPAEHLYTNQTNPYFRAPHIYIGVAARFMPGRKVLTDDEARRINVDSRYFGDCSDAVLLTTRGGGTYVRTFLESYVRPGIGLENWVSRTNYPALGIVPTGNDELSMYIQKNYGQPTARLDRYVLRPDGFVSVSAPFAGGELITRTLRFSLAAPGRGERVGAETRLWLNMSTSAAGSIRVEIRDAGGQPLPGFALDDAVELVGDELERSAAWKQSFDVSPLAGRPIQLRFVMRDADLYSLRFGTAQDALARGAR